MRATIKAMPFIVFLVFATFALSQQPPPGKSPNQGINGPPHQETPGQEYDANNIKGNLNEFPSPLDKEVAKTEQRGANPDNGKTQEESDRAIPRNSIWEMVAILVSFAEVIILAFTFFAVKRSARKQLEAYITMESIARETTQRQLRAYIFPDKFVFENAVGPIPPSLAAIFKNSGQTPAFHMICCSDVGWGKFPPSINFSLAEDISVESRGSIGPGASFTQTYPMDKPLAEEDKRGIESEGAAIYFYGYVKYRDIFDKPHRTNFRVYYTGELISGGPILMFACSEGNEAD